MQKATIEYDFQENPSKAVDNNGSQYYVRIQNNQMITEKEIGQRLQTLSTITEIDVTAVLAGMEKIIAEELAKGNTVSLGQLCRFEPTLGTVGKCNGTEKGNVIRLKKINVRPAKLLVDMVEANLAPCKRVHVKHSPKVDKEAVCEWLTEFFQTHQSVRRVDLEEGLGLTRSLAGKYVHQLKLERKLLHPGVANDSHYFPGPHFLTH